MFHTVCNFARNAWFLVTVFNVQFIFFDKQSETNKIHTITDLLSKEYTTYAKLKFHNFWMKYPLCCGRSYLYNFITNNECTHSTHSTHYKEHNSHFIHNSLGHKTVLTRKDISVICFEQPFLYNTYCQCQIGGCLFHFNV